MNGESRFLSEHGNEDVSNEAKEMPKFDEEELYRNLIFDAFTYGAEDGGLRSKSEINLIVCYVLSNTNSKLNSNLICETMVSGGIANYFEVANAISRLVENGIIIEDEEGFLTATSECKRLTEIIEKDLPYTLRERSIRISTKLAVTELYKKEDKVEIEENKNGKGFTVTLHVTDRDKEYMILTLNVPTYAQAEMIKTKFIEDPVKIYDNLITSLFE